MKKILLFLTFLAIGGTVSAQQVVADKIVAVVGNSAVLYSEVYETSLKIQAENRRQNYTSDRDPMTEALEQLLLQKLLYNQALIDSVKVGSVEAIFNAVEAEVAAMTEKAGGVMELEIQYGKPVFDIREDLRRRYEEGEYANEMRRQIVSDVQITTGEVEQWYRTINKDSLPMIPERYSYAQITRNPIGMNEAKQRARERLLELRERIVGGARFDVLARMYSVDNVSAANGGEMEPMPLYGFLKPFADALAKLQPGQVSEVVETEVGFHIIQLINVNSDMYRCRHILLRPEFTPEDMAIGDRLLDSLAGVIRDGKVTFEFAALEYSDDKYSRQNGGLVTNHEYLELVGASSTRYTSTKFMREELRNDAPYLRTLKVGEISNAFQSTDLRGNALSKIVKLIEIFPAHKANLVDDYLEVEQQALIAKQEVEFEKWLTQKIASMYIRISPEFRDADFMNKGWKK